MILPRTKACRYGNVHVVYDTDGNRSRPLQFLNSASEYRYAPRDLTSILRQHLEEIKNRRNLSHYGTRLNQLTMADDDANLATWPSEGVLDKYFHFFDELFFARRLSLSQQVKLVVTHTVPLLITTI